jgi:uncharacterized protein YqjF (DUF2071 family)
MHPLLGQTAHRPFPLPRKPWIMFQRWHDLLFMHWPIDPERLRGVMPWSLRDKLDIRDGKAWVGVVPFWMSHIHVRGLPPFPGLSTFPELNVRTYVTVNGKPGVYFFSLDATNLAAVVGARAAFGLRYYAAAINVQHDAGTVKYSSKRLHGPAPAEFIGVYSPLSPETFTAVPGSLESFFCERYCLYVALGQTILRANIHHLPWPLQEAECQAKLNTVAESQGIELPAQFPHLLYAHEMDVLIWPPELA